MNRYDRNLSLKRCFRMKKYCCLVSLLIVFWLSGCNYQDVAKNNPNEQPTSSFEKNEMQPIVFATEEGLCLLGGYSNGRWIGVKSIDFAGLSKARESFKKINNVSVDILKGNESFNFYANQQFIKQKNASGAPYYYSSPASCEDFYM